VIVYLGTLRCETVGVRSVVYRYSRWS